MNLKNKIINVNFINSASEIADKLELKVFIVGGFIRDLILNRKNEDIDFLVVGDVLKFSRELAGSLGIDDIVIYKTFGTAHFTYQGLNLEFVGARKESYRKSSRKPEV
jgi:poly(A) polymerase